MEKIIENIHDEPIDFRDLFVKYFRRWPFFIITVALALFVAFLHNKIKIPVYNVRTTLLISEDENRNDIRNADILSSFELFPITGNFENEIYILKSTPIIKSALSRLNFNTSYYIKHNLGYNDKELYELTPFIVSFDKEQVQPINMEFHIKFINEKQFQIKAKGKDVKLYNFSTNTVVDVVDKIHINKISAFDENIESDFFNFKVLINHIYLTNELRKNRYSFKFNNINDLIYQYQNDIQIEPVMEDVTLAKIFIETNNVNKAKDFLRALTQEYLKRNLDKRNYIATNTVEYIDNQLGRINDSLTFTEKKLEDFQSNHEVMDISLKSTRLYEQLRNFQEQKEQLTLKIKNYQYIYDYFEENKDISDLNIPSSVSIEEPLLSNLVNDLTVLINEKNNLIDNRQEKSPYLKQLNIKIENLKNTIFENIKYSLNTSNLTLNDVNKKISSINYEINKLPSTSRELVNIERKFNINDAIYTYLLQRKAEAEISKASNLPSIEIIEPPEQDGNFPISPKTRLNYLIALIVGLLVPSVFISVSTYFKDHIKNRKEIEKHSRLPILGQIIHNNRSSEDVLLKYPKSASAESFRLIRTNLDFFSKGKENQIILITSCFGAEGKTFSALNIALSFAMFDKKTVLLDFDLRKPRLSENLMQKNGNGISSYLINSTTMDDIIYQELIDNFYFMPAGRTPPNPVELIASENTNKLLTQLRDNFNYIIIDTPPIGLVTDAYLLMKYADNNIIVIREDYTSLREFLNVQRELYSKNLSNVCLLINDVKVKRSRYDYDYYAKKRTGKAIDNPRNNTVL